MIKHQTLASAVDFHYLFADKFTAETFTVHFVLPLTAETVSGYSLLAKLFKKGCRAFPTQGALAKRLEELYATSLSVAVSKQGESQVISLSLDMLSSRFVFDGTNIADEAFSLLCDVIFDPALDSEGLFPASSVEREKAALSDAVLTGDEGLGALDEKTMRELLK